MLYRVAVFAAALVAVSLPAQTPTLTCVSSSRECRSSSVKPARDVVPARWVRAGRAAQSAEDMMEQDADNNSLPWVLWSSEGVYFAAACKGAWQIPANRRLYARDNITLEQLGYLRASARAEDCTAQQVLDHARRVRAVQSDSTSRN